MKFSEIENKLNEKKVNWEELNILKTDYVPMGTKYGVEKTTDYRGNGIIELRDGFAVMNRLNYELNLYFLLITLYTNIEFEDEITFTGKMCDLFAKNKFKQFLSSKTKNDSYEFENLFKNFVLDEIRYLNTNQNLNVDGLKEAISGLDKINPEIFKLVDFDKSTTLKEVRKAVDKKK